MGSHSFFFQVRPIRFCVCDIESFLEGTTMVNAHRQLWTYFATAAFVAFSISLSGCGSEQLNLRALTGHAKNDNNDSAASLTGNGAPAGKHFSLNLIGVPKTKSATITAGN